MLDEHDDFVADLAVHIQQLINICTSSSETSPCKIASRRLSHLQRNLSSISAAITSLPGGPNDICILRQYQEQLGHCKKELADVRGSLLSLDLEEADELSALQTNLEKEIFDCFLKLHASSHPHDPPTTSSDGKGVKLP